MLAQLYDCASACCTASSILTVLTTLSDSINSIQAANLGLAPRTQPGQHPATTVSLRLVVSRSLSQTLAPISNEVVAGRQNLIAIPEVGEGSDIGNEIPVCLSIGIYRPPFGFLGGFIPIDHGAKWRNGEDINFILDAVDLMSEMCCH